MKNAIIAACCLVVGLGVTPVESMSQHAEHGLVRIAYKDRYKDVSVHRLNHKIKLKHLVGVRINDLDAENTELTMRRISQSKKLRTLIIEGCSLNDQFSPLFDQLGRNNLELEVVKIEDSKINLTRDDSFSVWKTLAKSRSLREWSLKLPALTSTQNRIANRCLKDIGQLNEYIDATNKVYTKLCHDHKKTRDLLISAFKQCEVCKQKLIASQAKPDEYKALFGEYTELCEYCSDVRRKYDRYWVGERFYQSNIEHACLCRGGGILAMNSIEKMKDDYLESVIRDYAECDWVQAIGPFVK